MNLSIAAFTIDVTWHETAGSYSRTLRDRNGQRMLLELRDAVAHHDAFGRMYNVIAHFTDGRRETLSGTRLAAVLRNA